MVKTLRGKIVGSTHVWKDSNGKNVTSFYFDSKQMPLDRNMGLRISGIHENLLSGRKARVIIDTSNTPYQCKSYDVIINEEGDIYRCDSD